MSQVAISSSGPSLVEGYREVVGDGPMQVLEALARRLRGHRITMVNSTSTGGGVAEILHRLVRLLNELGVPTSWEVMPGDMRFYGITKTIHNTLHGAPGSLTREDQEWFRDAQHRAASALALDGDLVLIHDPQPVGLAALRRRPGQHWVWRCHIDLSRAQAATWDFLAPEVGRYDAAVFSHRTFVPRLDIPAWLVPPSIDPYSDKNRDLSDDEIRELLEPFDLPVRRPWVTQISRFDRLKDPIGVIDAFLMSRRHDESHLILAGGGADDDPEGAEVLAEVNARAAGRRDISVLLLPSDAHLVVNALQRRSTVVLQKSLREGFALTVSEGLWKQRAVIASAVGGIPLQVLHERTGLLVRSNEGAALQISRLLRNPDLRRRLGRDGREHVRHHFLHPREARDYLAVFARLVEEAER
jgi:trehalose synthase